MGHWADWTPQELANKADSEGGVVDLLLWGGANVFECLGADAVRAASLIEIHLEYLKSLLPDPSDDGGF